MSNEARTKQGESSTGLTNEQLAARIQAGENVSQNMARLYSQVKGFIHSIAWKYRGCGVELEDLAQEGFLGLYDAVAGYDWSQNANFLTYAGKWVRSKMVRYIQANGRGCGCPITFRRSKANMSGSVRPLNQSMAGSPQKPP